MGRRLDPAEAELEKASREPRATRLRNDYLACSVAYNGLLVEIAELGPAREASQGFLPADIAEQVRVMPAYAELCSTFPKPSTGIGFAVRLATSPRLAAGADFRR
jgi:hypothetical protein